MGYEERKVVGGPAGPSGAFGELLLIPTLGTSSGQGKSPDWAQHRRHPRHGATRRSKGARQPVHGNTGVSLLPSQLHTLQGTTAPYPFVTTHHPASTATLKHTHAHTPLDFVLQAFMTLQEALHGPQVESPGLGSWLGPLQMGPERLRVSLESPELIKQGLQAG